MPTSYSLNQQANRLYTDIHAVMAQIRAAESGTRLEREQFLALLAQKQSILAEASNIINPVSHTLDLACSDPSARVPHSQYLELKNARAMAREVKKTARSTPARSTPVSYVPSTPAAPLFSESDWLYESVDDEDLPF